MKTSSTKRLALIGACCSLLTAPTNAALNYEAGFSEIEPVGFKLQIPSVSTASYTSSRTRLFYAFQPADVDPANKPLAIFFNGGPGSSTGLLWGFNTSHMTLDSSRTGGKAIASNPNSWSSFANLLYVDARCTGFSYGMMTNPQNDVARAAEFHIRNFNSYIDGADFVRLLLRFLKSHPELRSNPVVVVGESYGGIRADVIFDLLLRYQEFGNGNEIYQDTALVREIKEHYAFVFPTFVGQTVPPTTIATQFGHQVLIQPLMTSRAMADSQVGNMWELPGSIIYDLAKETGRTFTPCAQAGCNKMNNAITFVQAAGRDLYAIHKPMNWVNGNVALLPLRLNDISVLQAITGIDPHTMTQLYATSRAQAYRVNALTPLGLMEAWLPQGGQEALPIGTMALAKYNASMVAAESLSTVFGPLQNWDRYYMTNHNDFDLTFYGADAFKYQISPNSNLFGERALRNMYYVKTFITNARNDMVCYAPALKPVFLKFPSLVSGVVIDTVQPVIETRRGEMRLAYQAGVFGEKLPAQTRTIRFPYYANSGHAVSLFQPQELMQDVKAWLTQSIIVGNGPSVQSETKPNINFTFSAQDGKLRTWVHSERTQHIRFELFQKDGKKLATLFSGSVSSGSTEVHAPLQNLSAGEYLAVLSGEGNARVTHLLAIP